VNKAKPASPKVAALDRQVSNVDSIVVQRELNAHIMVASPAITS